ncbi:3-deoxy-7-phosphoheptulonate synthase [Actinoalloteichus hoggarensis]|uniref:Phospho-2-dehydro-3-deoxyheptonate aldolase n=1 Tax=Actinoalloteichus hoggarensis TaxID=1470176 RepID=A0A221W0A8_9PSEU|nr:Phospho-2-dehydro-3-deoxyheptonate aldolase, Phe-sensitive [Actinoalloteichus hoggarensis]MBB5920442.1 3-deoxy-7-phosphoheptulonate synthase [Actinoalloteichus hoggarensis]
MTLTLPSDSDLIRDRHIAEVRPLVSPALLRDELPLSERAAQVVTTGRDEVIDVLTGRDDRLLVVVGPCSVHDPDAALTYARRLATLAESVRADLRIVMRVYFEKPRTTLGWKGLINDPDLDGSFQVNKGLRLARRLLLDILELGLPVGCEFLDPITPQYIADTVSWGSIGARTAQSQVHRQLSSGLSMPIGIKNATDGDVQVAVDAIRAAASSHVFTGITDGGLAAILRTTGNPDCHVVLRGSSAGPNHDAESVAATMALLDKAGLPARTVIDASHGNSGKDHRRQPVVAAEVASRLAAGESGVVGVMLESFLLAGRQDLSPGRELEYGQSITDACMDWETTESTLRGLAAAIAERRSDRRG